MRLSELGTVYRYERSGMLHGLLRVRGFTQDDAHIFCTEEQLQDEIASALDFVISVLRAFGFDDFLFYLSTQGSGEVRRVRRDLGAGDERARAAIAKHGLEYQLKEGDAAFYGPKIDIDVRDAIGRKWQLSTIQCDFNHPERSTWIRAPTTPGNGRSCCTARCSARWSDSSVASRALRRAFPVWLAPIQARILPVAAAHEEYAHEMVARLRGDGFRADSIDATDQLGKRIRTAKLEKLPYVLVVGDDDVANKTFGVNPRGGEVERGVPSTPSSIGSAGGAEGRRPSMTPCSICCGTDGGLLTSPPRS